MKKIKTLVALGAIFAGSSAFAGGSCQISNLDAWSSVANTTNKLSVTANAAMGGTSCGLEIEVQPQPTASDRVYVQDSSPSDETRYRQAFCLDPNSTVFNQAAANKRLKVHIAQCAGGAANGCANSDVVQFKLQNPTSTPTGYELLVYVRDANTGNTRNTEIIPIGDEPTRVEYDLNLAANQFRLWVNATSEADTPVMSKGVNPGDDVVDFSPWAKISRARFGSMDKSNNVQAGDTFYIDEAESRRQTFIGGTCGNP